METEILKGPEGVARAAEILASGGLVSFPTETVYGLGADACNDLAVASIFSAKHRPSFNPLICHVPDLEAAQRFASVSPTAKQLAEAFWPGALTLVLSKLPATGLSPLVSAGMDTVAIRVPAHLVAQDLLRAFGGPVAAPSANPSGRVSPTSAAHVLAGLGGRIDAVLDGGLCPVGVESTIVDLSGPSPVFLRPGGVAYEKIVEVLGHSIPRGGSEERPVAPGQLRSHYAPAAPLRLNVTVPDADEIWLGFGPECEGAAMNLSPSGDLVEAAANLFGCLHELDACGEDRTIAIAPVPEHGLGLAINDRLQRAAAPRP